MDDIPLNCCMCQQIQSYPKSNKQTNKQTNKHNFNSFSLHLSFFQIPLHPKKLSCQKKIKVPIKTLRIFKKKNVILPAQKKKKKKKNSPPPQKKKKKKKKKK